MVAAATVPASIPALRTRVPYAALVSGCLAAYSAFPVLGVLQATLASSVAVGVVMVRCSPREELVDP